ncbi:MAG: hypothetical protein ACF788_12455 [Novipirellula sp. JB048]
MSRSEFLSASQLSPRKIVWITLLVVILGFVLFWPPEESSESPRSTLRPAARSLTSTSHPSSSEQHPVAADWPEFELPEVLDTNPFETIFVTAPPPPAVAMANLVPAAVPTEKQRPAAQPEALPAIPTPETEPEPELEPGTEAEPPAQLVQVAHEDVDIIYENAFERVAVIDSRLVRVGDMLDDGRVVEITPDDVIIEMLLSDDPAEAAASD